MPTGERYPALDLTPQVQSDGRCRRWSTSSRPWRRAAGLALYEDLHWIDPTTLELLGLLVDRIQGCRSWC